MQEIVGTGQAQILNLVLLDHAADAQDADILERVIGPDTMANFLAIDVRQHDVENDEVRPVFFDHHASVKSGGGHADFKAAVFFQDLGHELHEFDIVVDQENLAFAAFESV